MLRTLLQGYDILRNSIRAYPFILYLKPTSRCNTKCKSCQRWKTPNKIEDDMSLDEIKLILRKFKKAKFAIFTLWGGEPTLHKDMPDMLAEAKKMGYRTSICTNCLLIPKRAHEILPHLDVMLCSIDGYRQTHDEFRGVPGLFEHVEKAIKIATSSYPKCYIKIWASIHKKNINQIEELAGFAQRMGAKIDFFPLSPVEGHNESILLDRDELRSAFARVFEMKRKGFPITNPDRALKILQADAPFKCNFGRISIYIDHQGKVCSCEDLSGAYRHEWGDFKDFDPKAVFKSAEFKRVAKELENCNSCRLPCQLELSGNMLSNFPSLFASRVFR